MVWCRVARKRAAYGSLDGETYLPVKRIELCERQATHGHFACDLAEGTNAIEHRFNRRRGVAIFRENAGECFIRGRVILRCNHFRVNVTGESLYIRDQGPIGPAVLRGNADRAGASGPEKEAHRQLVGSQGLPKLLYALGWIMERRSHGLVPVVM